MQVGKITANLITGQRSESLRLIRKSAEEIRQFMAFPKYKERLIVLIDELIECRRRFDEQYSV